MKSQVKEPVVIMLYRTISAKVCSSFLTASQRVEMGIKITEQICVEICVHKDNSTGNVFHEGQ